MKQSHHTGCYAQEPICPNGADNQFFADRALNILTGIVSCVGFFSALAFLLTMN